MSHAQLLEEIADLLSMIPKEEAHVLRGRFGLEDGKSRSYEELAQELGTTPEEAEILEASGLYRLREQRPALESLGILDEPWEEAVSLESLPKDTVDERDDPSISAVRAELGAAVDGAVDCLTAKERRVITLKNGLFDGKARSRFEVAHEMNLREEEVDELEKSAWEKLKRPVTR